MGKSRSGNLFPVNGAGKSGLGASELKGCWGKSVSIRESRSGGKLTEISSQCIAMFAQGAELGSAFAYLECGIKAVESCLALSTYLFPA